MKSRQKVGSAVLLFFSALFPIIIGSRGGFSPANVITTLATAFVIDIIYVSPKIKQYGVLFIFSPCILSVIYISLNSIIGCFFMMKGWCLDYTLLVAFHSIGSEVLFKYTLLTAVFNAILCIIAFYQSNRFIRRKNMKEMNISVYRVRNIVILSIALTILATIPSIIYHGERTTSNIILSLYFPVYLSVLACLFYNVLRCSLSNIILFAVIVGLFVFSSVALFHSKREAFFCLIVMILMFLIDKTNIRLKLRHVLLGVIVGALSIIMILASSLMRGYNNFEGESFVDAVKAIPQYVNSPTFMPAIGGNFEVVSAFPHTVNAFNYIEIGRIPTLYGETFWRVLFVPIPESLFGYKPRKMLAIYTELFDASYRNIGGSYPVMCYAEFYANFKFLAIVFLLLFFYLFEKYYYVVLDKWGDNRRISSQIAALCFFATFIMFTRGSGFSSYCIYGFLIWVSVLMISKMRLV